MKMKVLNNKILFKFLEDIQDGNLKQKTEWGFEVKGTHDDVKLPRWGVIIQSGPESKFNEGEYILIEPLMWTDNFEIDKQKFWMTQPEKVLASSKKEPSGLL